MRSPEKVLNSLASHSKDRNYRYQRLYRNLYNPDFFIKAYSKIYKNKGSMTVGIDESTLDNMSIKRIDGIIQKIKSELYQPQPAKRVYIPKKNGKMRPLGIPSSDDKLVQEVIRMILEAIYEDSFENCSHGFRANRSCHTALEAIQKNFTGIKWFIEGDIKGYFDNINHEILIKILSERIDDDKFLRLIRKFLKAGYIEEWKYNKTYSGTPQGGIISPILANIYLDKLDKYITEYKKEFDCGKVRKKLPQYKTLCYQIEGINKQLRSEINEAKRDMLIRELRKAEIERSTMPSGDPFDTNYRRLFYVRYADDFLIGVAGSKEECIKIKNDIAAFLKNDLDLELSNEKTLITNNSDRAQFLGFGITVNRTTDSKRLKGNVLRRTHNGRIRFTLNPEMLKKKLLELGALKIVVIEGKEIWKPQELLYLMQFTDIEIVDYYNSIIRGYYNYYGVAANCNKLHEFYYVLKYSMCKTFACKYRKSVHKVMLQHCVGKKFGVKYENNRGTQTRWFYDEGFKQKKFSYDEKNAYNEKCDEIQNSYKVKFNVSYIERDLLARKCAICGAENVDIQMHHVNKLKNLKGKKQWEKVMIARQRKTMPLCVDCHRKLHSGQLD